MPYNYPTFRKNRDHTGDADGGPEAKLGSYVFFKGFPKCMFWEKVLDNYMRIP